MSQSARPRNTRSRRMKAKPSNILIKDPVNMRNEKMEALKAAAAEIESMDSVPLHYQASTLDLSAERTPALKGFSTELQSSIEQCQKLVRTQLASLEENVTGRLQAMQGDVNDVEYKETEALEKGLVLAQEMFDTLKNMKVRQRVVDTEISHRQPRL